MIYYLLKRIFKKNAFWADFILDLLKLPSEGVVFRNLALEEDISIGQGEFDIKSKLRDYILREDRINIGGFDSIISLNVWPSIIRFGFKNGKLISVIYEIGVVSSNFRKVYSLIETKIAESFADSIKKSEGYKGHTGYYDFSWECAGHYCDLVVMSDKVTHFNTTLFDYKFIFDRDINTMFVRKPGTAYMVLPTLAFMVSKDLDHQLFLWILLFKELVEWGEVDVSSFPLFD